MPKKLTKARARARLDELIDKRLNEIQESFPGVVADEISLSLTHAFRAFQVAGLMGVDERDVIVAICSTLSDSNNLAQTMAAQYRKENKC